VPSAVRPPFDRALGAGYVVTAAERDAAVQESNQSTAERRHRLALSQALIAEETAGERARLEAETAQYETDAEAARVCLEPAVDARRRALEARAEAEAELAPEIARKALESDAGETMAALGTAYAAFCAAYGFADTPTFDRWVGNFRGLA
jgi:hypothetical protein